MPKSRCHREQDRYIIVHNEPSVWGRVDVWTCGRGSFVSTPSGGDGVGDATTSTVEDWWTMMMMMMMMFAPINDQWTNMRVVITPW